uniref:WW domain-containing protein n=1 Tax=Panagrellus redivivus TaxID=6233 RepID=A0A7E4W1F4_PANRE
MSLRGDQPENGQQPQSQQPPQQMSPTILSLEPVTLHGEPATQEQREILSKWAVFWNDDAKKFFYSDVDRQTTWTRPLNFPMEREREIYIQNIIERNISAGVPPSHEIANMIVKHLSDLDPLSYLGGFFRLPVEKLEDIVQERCAFFFRRLLDDRLMEIEDNRRLRPTSSWEFAQKILQLDRRYNLIVQPSKKKRIFNAWKQTAAEREQRMRAHNQTRAVQALQTILMNHPIVDHNSDYNTVMNYVGNEDLWKLVEYGSRRRAFDEAIAGIRLSIQMKEHEQRKRDIETFQDVLNQVEGQITVDTSWKKAQSIFMTVKSYAKNLQKMNKEDALCVFQAHMKRMWAECREERKQDKVARLRSERKLREGFCKLLDESREGGLIKLQSKWKDVAPFLTQDERFVQALNQPGPVPLDYFKFFMIEWNREFKRDLIRAMDLIKLYEFDMSMTTSVNVFTEFITNAQGKRPLNPINLPYIYNHLIHELMVKNAPPKDATSKSYHNCFLTELALIEKSSVVDITNEEKVKEHFDSKFQLTPTTEEVFLRLYRNFIGRCTDDEEGQILEGEDPEEAMPIVPASTSSSSTTQAGPSGSGTSVNNSHHRHRSRSPQRSKKSKKSKKYRKRRYRSRSPDGRRRRSGSVDSRDSYRRSRSPEGRRHRSPSDRHRDYSDSEEERFSKRRKHHHRY